MIVTDLFLDLWITRDGRCFVLDEEELANALVNHVISSRLAYDARRRLKCLAQKVKADRFPLPEVRRIEPLQGFPLTLDKIKISSADLLLPLLFTAR